MLNFVQILFFYLVLSVLNAALIVLD